LYPDYFFQQFSTDFKVFWDVLPCSQMTDVSEMRAASIIRAMSKTSVNIYLTARQYIPEDSKLHTRRRENLKSQFIIRFNK
jgi:hypothetical protein